LEGHEAARHDANLVKVNLSDRVTCLCSFSS
jgi:hypothetical protein